MKFFISNQLLGEVKPHSYAPASFFLCEHLSLFCVPHRSARNFPFSGNRIENESGNVAMPPAAPSPSPPPRSPTPLALGQPVVKPGKNKNNNKKTDSSPSSKAKSCEKEARKYGRATSQSNYP